MEQKNFTATVTEFILLGLCQNPKLRFLLFFIFLFVYMVTWIGNFTIIATVIFDLHLHTPMYFLLANLAFADVTYGSSTVPLMLSGFLTQGKIVSFANCFSQMFFFHFTGGAEVFFLGVMAVDRYIAIHKPLHYTTIMNRSVCMGLVAGAWLGGFVHSIVQIILLVQLPFCGPNKLDNFYCDVPQVIKLACTETFLLELLMVSNNGLITTIIFIILMLSYTIILIKIRTHITEGKHKAFSTCGAQIAVVCLIFFPSTFIYARPFHTFSWDKSVSVLYTAITPMLSPLIYTLRNNEMKAAIMRLINRIRFSIIKPKQ